MSLKEKGSRFYILLMSLLTVLLLHRILFTDQILNATDVTTQYIWEVYYLPKISYVEWFNLKWIGLGNFGDEITKNLARNLLPYRYIIFSIFPAYLGIAWEAALHIIFAGIGTFFYCRILGLHRFSSFIAAISFIFSSEIITLINAGHIGKISTITWAPLIFFFLEKGFQEKRPFYFLLTGGALAIQFFEMHWQISFYTCLAVGFYFIFRVINIFLEDKDVREGGRLTACGVLMIIIFFAAAMISFLPTYEWAKTSERSGGMAYEDGMSWSMPPEELVTYLVPGFFGLNRRESVYNPIPIKAYYWGRMWFAQATDYMGILPLILAGLALAYRRNRYTWLLASMAVITQVMALGKYTPVYRFMYEYLPGFSTFRVPKMILFLTTFSVAVLAGIGMDWLLFSEDDRKRSRIKNAIYVLAGLLAISGLLTLYAWVDREGLMARFHSALSRPGRNINDPNLAYNRYVNIIQWSCIYLLMLSISIGVLWILLKDKVKRTYIQVVMVLFLIGDVWIVNYKFMSTAPVPDIKANEIIKFLKRDKELYRILPLAATGSEFYFTHYDIPVLFGYNPVVDKRFAEVRERFDLDGNMADLLNVKYLIISKAELGGQPPSLGSMMGKYMVAFTGDPNSIVLMNTRYLPRAYPVHQVVVEKDKDLIFNILNDPRFSPREIVVIEEAPPAPLTPSAPSSASRVKISKYSNNDIVVDADMAQDGFLALSEKYYPGWKAYIDGKETKIYKANYVMRAVYLTKGPHIIKFIFDPWPYKVGLWVSSATFLFLIGVVVWRVRENKVEV